MKHTSPKFDTYFAKSQEFAVPILESIRKAAHKACPDIEEAMKWSAPTFVQNGIVAVMSSHKQHVRLSFWKGASLDDPDGLLEPMGETGTAGLKLTSTKDMPTQKQLVAWFKQGVRLNDKSSDAAQTHEKKRKKVAKRPPPKCPTDLMAALKKSEKALATYEGLTPACKREYVEWVEDAKREATRVKRVATAVEWMSQGKTRNWKYRNC